MTGSDIEEALRRHLGDIAMRIDAAPDLAERISSRRATRRRRRLSLTAAAVSLVVVAATATVVIGHSDHSSVDHISVATSPTTDLAQVGLPTADDIANGRFIRSVQLDNGTLTITPAPSTMQPEIDQTEAGILVGSDSQTGGGPFGCSVQSGRPCSVLGFGEVSINTALTKGVHNMPAWIGILATSTAVYQCGNTTIPPTPVTTAPGTPAPLVYEAAVVDGSGTKVLNYTSRASICGSPPTGPSVTDGAQVVSIPWQLVALHGQTITFRYEDPPCDPYTGLYTMDLSGNTKTEQGDLAIWIQAPYGLTYTDLLQCGGPWTTTSADFGPQSEAQGGPPPLTPKDVTHARTGPIGAP